MSAYNRSNQSFSITWYNHLSGQNI